MKKEFDYIQLIDKEKNWKKDNNRKIITAINEDASIFAYFKTADYKLLIFKKGQSFQIKDDSIIYDESTVREGVV